MDLQELLVQTVKEITDSGELDTVIKEAVKKTITEVLRDKLTRYSDFSTLLESKIKKSLGVESMELDFPSYNQMIADWTREVVDREVISAGKKQIQEKLSACLKPLEKTTWKISEIIEKFKQDVVAFKMHYGGRNDSDIVFIREVSDICGVTTYYFSADPDVDGKYACEYQICVNSDKKIFRVNIDGVSSDHVSCKPLYSFDSFMFQLYSMSCSVEDDYNDVDVTAPQPESEDM